MKDKLIISTLENELKVLYRKLETTNSFYISFALKAGPLFETNEQQGFSHFFEHIVFTKTEKFKTKNDFLLFCDNYGFQFNAATTNDLIYFYLGGHKDHIDKAILALEQIACYHEITHSLVELEKIVINQEIEKHYDTLDSYRFFLCLNNLYKNGFHDICGTKESISIITPELLSSFIEDKISVNNSFICISGNIDLDKVINLLNNSAFNRLTTKPEPIARNLRLKHTNHITTIPVKNTNQIYLSYVYKMPKMTLRNRIFDLIVYFSLSGLNSSIMNNVLRDREGLAYVLYSYTMNIGTNSLFFLNINIEKDKLNKTMELLDTEIIPSLINMNDEKLLFRIQNNIKTIKQFSEEQTLGRLFSILPYIYSKEHLSFDILEKQLQKITLQDIQTYCSKHLTKRNVYIIGNT